MNLILLAGVFVFLYLATTSYLLPYVTPKSVQFGVRIPRLKESDPEVRAVKSRYFKILLAGLPVILLGFLASSIYFGSTGFFFIGLAVEMIYTHADYIFAFRFLHKYKISHEWYDGIREFAGTVLPEYEGVSRAITGAYFILPSLGVIAIGFIIGAMDYSSIPALIPLKFFRNGTVMAFESKTLFSVFRFMFYQIGITGGFLLIGTALTRTRREIDVSRPYTTYEQQTRFKDFYRDALYSLSSMFGITFLLASIRVWDYPSIIIQGFYVVVPLILGAMVLVMSTYLVGQMGTRIRISGASGEDTGENNVDDDTEWKIGMFYFNPRDPSILIGRRFGIGWTINLGNPRSWIILVSLLSVYALIASHLLFHLL